MNVFSFENCNVCRVVRHVKLHGDIEGIVFRPPFGCIVGDMRIADEHTIVWKLVFRHAIETAN